MKMQQQTELCISVMLQGTLPCVRTSVMLCTLTIDALGVFVGENTTLFDNLSSLIEFHPDLCKT